ncbi:S8 family serine peptidase [Isoptericola haloaureus]|uniref:S8 family serine peptidase n=1 Tax=Isoptericola haloaureus TaxID=1542902 RepID=A0ABU7Z3I3_9MICO
MRSLARAGLAATAAGAVLAAGAFPALGADGPGAPDDPTTTTLVDETTTVTLVTGDVVHVSPTGDGQQAVTVDPAPGATGPARTMEIGGDLYVVPAAADPYLASGALDEELFNVTGLLEDGYDDASVDGLPVIAQYDTRLRGKPTVPPGAAKKLDLASVDGAALVTDSDEATAFWEAVTAAPTSRAASEGRLRGGLSKLWLDGRMEASLDVSVPLVGAPEAWDDGHDGTGATVAVLDTGVDAEHPDLADVVTLTESFVPGETVVDAHGHGTHVASTVAGSGAASEGANTGVAPGADVAVGKVLGDDGYGQDSWIIAGMEWAATTADADVVNMSLGDSSRTDQTDPIAQAVNALTAETDALFVVSAGNSGAVGTVTSPGTADAALTVAATDDSDRLAYFSSRGPRGLDDGLKPDVAAPGVGISAARSQFSSGSGDYRSMSGTSMASPHVAGAAAILKAANPGWGAQRIKDAVMSSATPLDYTLYEVGTGRLDVPAALDGVDATGSVYFGKVAWGDEDPEPQTRTLTYSNDTDTDVELDLTSTTDGAADLVRLSEASVVVPAGGSVDVEASAAFGTVPDPGHYLGEVVATTADGTVVARTGTGLTREDERYDLTVSVLGLDGEPLPAEVMLYRYGTTDFTYVTPDEESGEGVVRVAPGIFAASVELRYVDTDGTDRTYWLNAPHLAVTDGDVDLVLDTRDTNPVQLETPRASAEYSGRVEWFHDAGLENTPYTTFLTSVSVTPGVEVWTNPTGEVAGEKYSFTSRWSRTAPLLDLRAKTPGSVALDPVYQIGSSRLDGKVDLDAVVLSTGTSEEIEAADVEGKAVVIEAGGTTPLYSVNRDAAAAGAALLVVVNDGPGTLYTYAGATALPVVSVSADEGAELLAAGSGPRFRGTATAFPDYSYEIAHTWADELPADLTVAPQASELVQVTDRLADPESRLAYIGRYDCPDYGRYCFGGVTPRTTGGETLTYLSAPGESSAWYAEVSSTSGWSVRDDTQQYAPGERTTIDWFGVAAPHQGPGFWKSQASGAYFRLNVPYASSNGDLTGTFSSSGRTVTTRLYQDDELVRERPSQAFQGWVPEVEGAHTYRYEMDTTLAPETWPYSSSTSTAWTFVHDQASPEGLVPIISLGYDVPTDLTGTIPAGHPVEIAVTAHHEAEAVGTGTLGDVAVEVSYDEGATWSPAVTSPDGEGRWTLELDAPRGADSVSLRAEIQDDAGNGVTQEIVRAVGLS